MAFFTKKDIGRVYVIKMILPGHLVVHKIGMCHSARSLDRMMEVLRSWFCSYRFVPYSELKMDLECNDPKKLEAYIHRVLDKHRFEPNYKVEGYTEMFTDINELRVITHLRQFNDSNHQHVQNLTENDYDVICRLLTG